MYIYNIHPVFLSIYIVTKKILTRGQKAHNMTQ
jgi:hypothetical protein